jgi:hypothetical protein
VGPGAAAAYTDRALWERTTYAYSVSYLDAAGALVGTLQASATTGTRTAVARLFASTSFVNEPIGSATVDAHSAAIVDRAIVGYKSSANFTNSDDWGIPIASADTATPRYSIGCEYYWCDVQFAPFPVPRVAQPSGGSDHHLAVISPDGGELDMWIAARRDGGWTSGSRWVTSTEGSGANCAPGQRCGGANAANFALAAGVVRPEEIAQGHIDHALMITTPYTRRGVKACPATSTDGQNDDVAAAPIGARLQLDPAVNVDALALPAWKKTIARALQNYGAYVVDTSGSLALRAESNLGRGYDAWSRAGVPNGSPSIADIPWQRMQVLSYDAC